MSEKNKCIQCGMELEHATTVKKDGKAFCSNSCANTYANERGQRRGCC